MNFDDPVATALRVARLLERADLAYGLYGGLAVAGPKIGIFGHNPGGGAD